MKPLQNACSMFHRNERIRFQRCDPAGIVFYPPYVEMINSPVEDWFSPMRIGFAEIHQEPAIPAVSPIVDLRVPSWLGETLVFGLDAMRFGMTSIRDNP